MTTPMFSGELRFLSNFAPATVRFEDAYYVTTEHAYQAAKTLDYRQRFPFQDPTMTPGQAKRMGRTLTLRPDWERVKLPVMRQLLAAKFSDTRYRDLLVNTWGLVLIETNGWHDNEWGDCWCRGPNCREPGKNLLGRSLMELRHYLAGGWRP